MVNGTYLLDTNIVSDGSKISPSKKVVQKLDLYLNSCKISSITWYELQKGLKRLPEGKKKTYIKNYIDEQILPFYEILPYDKNCADIQSDIFSTLAEKGIVVPYQDSQIAAIALSNDLVLVTRNIKDFLMIKEYFPLKLENWFD